MAKNKKKPEQSSPKRYAGPKPHDGPDGDFLVGLKNNALVAGLLGQMVASFEHLDEAMERLMAPLIGTTDVEAAAYALRSVRQPNNRAQVLTTLLQNSPVNRQLGTEYDQAIERYRQLSIRRNKLVHGRWYTHHDSEDVYLAEPSAEGYSFGRERRFKAEELETLIREIRAHQVDIIFLSNKGLALRAAPMGQAEPPNSQDDD